MRSEIAFALALFAFLVPCRAWADEPAAVVVTVKDAQTGVALPLARVTLVGPSQVLTVTDAEGRATVRAIAPGDYVGVVGKPGYRSTRIPQFSVVDGSPTALSVTLSKDAKVIATVSVTSARRQATFGQDDVVSATSGSNDRALVDNPYLDAARTATGTGPLSIDGHDPSRTGVNVDGVPIVPIGTIPTVRSIPFDLTSSAEVKPGGASSGGGLNLSLPDPTLAFLAVGRTAGASQGDDGFGLSVRGTSGVLGYAGGLSRRQNIGPENGQVFFDGSGQTYAHSDMATVSNGSIKLRIPTSSQSALNITGLDSTFTGPDFCDYLIGLQPCGFGPNNFSTQHLSSLQIREQRFTDSYTYSVALFGSLLHSVDDQTNRTVFGLPLPFTTASTSSTTGVVLDANQVTSHRHQLGLNYRHYLSVSTGNYNQAGTIAMPIAEESSFDALTLRDAIQFSRRLKLQTGVGVNEASSAPPSALLTLSPSWQLDKLNAVAGSAALGTLGESTPVQNGLSVSDALAFDCSGRTALGSGPGATISTPSKSSRYDISVSHRTTWVSLDASAYSETVRNAVLSAYASGVTLPSSTATTQYLASASSLFASPVGCAQTYSLQQSDLLLNERLVADAAYSGFRMSGRFAVGAGFVFAPYYVSTVAHALQTSAATTLRAGDQIPGVPLQRYGASLDWQSRSKSAEIAATVNHVADNNANALPSFTVVGIAARLASERGRLTVSVSNLFNQFAYPFGSTSYASPLSIPGQRSFLPLAQPLAPRTFRISYAVESGRSVDPRALDSSDDDSPEAETSFETRPLTDHSVPPYEIDRTSASCGPEQVSRVSDVLRLLKSYVGSNHYTPSKELSHGEFALYRTDSKGNPIFLIGGRKASIISALFSCVAVHGATAAQAASAGLYVPTTLDSNFQLVFSPGLGFYFTFDQQSAQLSHGNIKPLAKVSKEAQFALDASASDCSGVTRTTASYVLDQLKSYFSGNIGAIGAMDGINVQAGDSTKTWYRITTDDMLALVSVRACATIFSVPREMASQLHLGISDSQSILYAPSIGFYTIP